MSEIDRMIAWQREARAHIDAGGPDADGAMRGIEDALMEECILRQQPLRATGFVVHVYESGLKYDVYIGRGRCPKTHQYGQWGNPWSNKPSTAARFHVATVEEAMERYEEWLTSQSELVALVKKELRGKVLGCWCKTRKHPDAPCHGDILARIANAEAAP